MRISDWSSDVCSSDLAAVCDTSPASIAKAMKHVRDLVGVQHVALGSDYDGATTVRFDTSKLVQVTQALIDAGFRSEEHTSELQSLMRISYAVFCLKKKKTKYNIL